MQPPSLILKSEIVAPLLSQREWKSQPVQPLADPLYSKFVFLIPISDARYFFYWVSVAQLELFKKYSTVLLGIVVVISHE